MHDKLPVSVSDRFADLQKKFESSVSIKIVFAAIEIYRRAFDKLHHVIRRFITGKTTVKQANNVWVLEFGENAPFFFEAFDEFIREKMTVDELDGDALFKFIVNEVCIFGYQSR